MEQEVFTAEVGVLVGKINGNFWFSFRTLFQIKTSFSLGKEIDWLLHYCQSINKVRQFLKSVKYNFALFFFFCIKSHVGLYDKIHYKLKKKKEKKSL